MLAQGAGPLTGLVGAFETTDRRYIDFVDGSIMTDGYFNSVLNQFFGTLYNTGVNPFTCLAINSGGNIEVCTSTNVLCEKTLIKDTMLCLNSTDLPEYIVLNTSTTIQIPSKRLVILHVLAYKMNL